MLARRTATILGLFLLIEGIWGLFSPVVFGVLTTNTVHAIIHIVLGILGLFSRPMAFVGTYLVGVGTLLALVGILYFVPGASDLIVSILNVNGAVAWLNIIVGVACVGIVLSAERNAPAPRA
jgi:hypothetical protein